MKKVWLVVILTTFFCATFAAGRVSVQGYVFSTPKPTPFTGQELWSAVNNYRKDKGLQELKLDKDFCNNIASRWDMLVNPNNIAHQGFKDWAKENLPPGVSVSELYTVANTPQGMINNWNSSPSHYLFLNNPEDNKGCAYVYNFSGVIEVGH